MPARGFLDFLAPILRTKPRGEPRRGLDGTVLTIAVASGPIDVLVNVRPAARRLILRIDRRSGGATLTLPRGTGRTSAERFLADHAGWLEARMKALPARIPFVAGAEISFRGENHYIEHRAPFRGETHVTVEDGRPVLIVHGDAAHVPGRVLRFLREEALRAFTLAAEAHAAQAGVTLGRISIKDTRSRWGSCSARGDLSFSWRMILAPPFVLDYLAAHEVAHRLEMNHSPRYWRHVRALVPDFERAEAWLTRHGPALHHYGEA